jgi:AraC-like DNA-binding protein
MSTRIGDGRHHIQLGDEFIASRSKFFPELEVFAREQHTNCYPYHLHDRWQLTWVLSGRVDLKHRGGSNVLEAGDAFLAAPLEPVAGHKHRGLPFGFVTLQIPDELVGKGAIADQFADGERVLARRRGGAMCEKLMQRLMLASDGESQRVALDEMLTSFIAPTADSAMVATRRGRAHPVVERTCCILDDSLEEGVPLTDVAGAVQLNHRYVISLFKTAIGVTPHQYVMSRRIESARRLVNLGQSLNSVAASTGYNDQSHMTRVFKRTFGVNPGAYQARSGYMNFLQNFPVTVS